MLLTSAVPCASPSQPPDIPCCSSAVAATAGSAADVPAEVAELQAELELLRAKVESHPEVKRFAVENLHLSEVGGWVRVNGFCWALLGGRGWVGGDVSSCASAPPASEGVDSELPTNLFAQHCLTRPTAHLVFFCLAYSACCRR
jgi:hypothetical protein